MGLGRGRGRGKGWMCVYTTEEYTQIVVEIQCLPLAVNNVTTIGSYQVVTTGDRGGKRSYCVGKKEMVFHLLPDNTCYPSLKSS